MKRSVLLFLSCFFIQSFQVFGQIDDEEFFNSLLNEEVENVNAVYKPVIGFGVGVLNFYGDVRNNNMRPTLGTPAYKLNVATFLDNKHFFKANFTLNIGTLTGNERSLDTLFNRNFSSDIFTIGLNLHYDFRHFIKSKIPVRPFVSLGIENISFNSKTDLVGTEGNAYHYWTDGTIRNISERYNSQPSVVIKRDYKYETDLRSFNNGSYSLNTFGIPVDVGFDFSISDRVNLRIGQSYHFTFTQNIDGVSSKNSRPEYRGKGKRDWFTMSYFTLHLDLFSDDKTILVNKMFADVTGLLDFDMLNDEDNDGVFDGVDKCFGTPMNVPVDTVGCPLDDDKDGVPNYMDKEPTTSKGALVDDKGVTLDTDKFAESINKEAIGRRDVEIFLMMHKAQNRYSGKSSKPIPGKFKSVDRDGDAYISFDELLKAIDDFFDFSSPLTSKDIYELQDFFFEQ